jgi:tetratricopeptide (TPR) repeat protein
LAYRDLMLFNLGNNHAARGELAEAAGMYTEAVGVNGSLADAYLNRANIQVKREKYREAVEDYRVYLNLAPDTSQKAQIERMIALLTKSQEDQERERLAAELRKKEEEERRRFAAEQLEKDEEARRIADEKRRRETEARQKALLDSILNSLQTSSGATQNLKAEGEGIQEVKPNSDIEN